MPSQQIGILHPGEMGVSLATAAQQNGHHVCWTSEGRSLATSRRAAQFGLRDVHTLASLCAQCSLIVSICPPDAAETIALQVAAQGFTGLYLDANAIAPQRAVRIGHTLTKTGASFVDGGIIGGPVWEPGPTYLYLSGPRAHEVAACFSADRFQTRVLDATIGRASAFKMCYAAHTKGTAALLCAILAAAEQLGVREALYQQWASENAGFVEHTSQRVRGITAKAWRFAGEMEEIAATFSEAGLPGDFHLGAAKVYQQLASFKDAPAAPALEDVLAALVQTDRLTE